MCSAGFLNTRVTSPNDGASAFGHNRRMKLALLALPFVWLATASATSQTYSIASAPRAPASGWTALHRTPRALLAEHRALTAALGELKPQRPGVVDAYVVVAGLDSDANFGREAAEAGRVLARRYDAAGRTIVMTADREEKGAVASPAALALALARVGELMDRNQDVLVLYTTSHGSAGSGLAYRDTLRGGGAISPDRMANMLSDAGAANRLLILSACYSGVFVPALASDTSVVITAAAADRSSFGCDPGNDWSFFGDALINRAFRKGQPVRAAFGEASASVAGWEAAARFVPSNPQISVGKDAARWLEPLEKRTPAEATRPVGRSPAGNLAG